ncbi:MAG: hypothetical protein WC389_03510 [Lutibacter sp.]|jgi:hypothetical protein
MTFDLFREKIIEYYKWNSIEIEMNEDNIKKLSVKHNQEHHNVLKALLLYNEKVKKKSFPDFVNNSGKWVNIINKPQKENIYADQRIEYVIESLLDSMEYSLQKIVENKEITSRFYRKNYRRIITKKYTYEDLNKKLSSFTISIDGKIEIVSEKKELFINQINQILPICNIEIISCYLINYFWDMAKWTDDLLLPLTANLDNDIIIQTKNNNQISMRCILNEYNKMQNKFDEIKNM